jgi:hypothetical protein
MNELAPINGASHALTAKARAVLARAEATGVAIRFLGYQPLFDDVRAYAGVQHDWVLAPAAHDPLIRRGELAIPKAELRVLRHMLDAGLDCQAVYLAHEIPKGRLALPSRPQALERLVAYSIDPAVGELLVDRVPVPPRTARIARHLGTTAVVLLTLLAAARPIGRTARWTARAVGSAGLGGTGAAIRGLDPIVFGAWTAGARSDPGVPAAFFELVRFTY